tara:strand:+ start:9 stop:824 length:816 start_codon:yes stop_codon:yes gene_type:complete
MSSVKDTDNLYNEALANYYKLKDEYEKKYNNKKSKIINNSLLTLKEKKKQINDIKKKCINCGRDGGSIFKYQDGNLIAFCGITNKPCNLNISIKKNKVLNIKSFLDELEYEIEKMKLNIIKVKLDFLFNYNNQEISLQLFKKYKDELQNLNSNYNDLFMKYIEIVNNEERKNKINENILVQNDLINKVKLLNKEFNKNGSIFLITEIVELYINELLKLNLVLLNLKYEYNNIEINDTTKDKKNIYKLFQDKNKIKDFEFTIEKPKVNSYKK